MGNASTIVRPPCETCHRKIDEQLHGLELLCPKCSRACCLVCRWQCFSCGSFHCISCTSRRCNVTAQGHLTCQTIYPCMVNVKPSQDPAFELDISDSTTTSDANAPPQYCKAHLPAEHKEIVGDLARVVDCPHGFCHACRIVRHTQQLSTCLNCKEIDGPESTPQMLCSQCRCPRSASERIPRCMICNTQTQDVCAAKACNRPLCQRRHETRCFAPWHGSAVWSICPKCGQYCPKCQCQHVMCSKCKAVAVCKCPDSLGYYDVDVILCPSCAPATHTNSELFLSPPLAIPNPQSSAPSTSSAPPLAHSPHSPHQWSSLPQNNCSPSVSDPQFETLC